jgi:hypothetical protein
MLQLTRLPKAVDPKQRCLWGENGNLSQRACLYSLLSPTKQHDLEWGGNDNTDWFNLVDPQVGGDAVLFSDADSAGVWVSAYEGHEKSFQTGFPTLVGKSGVAVCLHSYMASKPTLPERSYSVNLEYVDNLDGPQAAGMGYSQPLFRATSEYVSAPMSTCIHRATGEVIVADVFNGNLFKMSFREPFEHVFSTGGVLRTKVESPVHYIIALGVVTLLLLISVGIHVRNYRHIQRLKAQLHQQYQRRHH